MHGKGGAFSRRKSRANLDRYDGYLVGEHYLPVGVPHCRVFLDHGLALLARTQCLNVGHCLRIGMPGAGVGQCWGGTSFGVLLSPETWWFPGTQPDDCLFLGPIVSLTRLPISLLQKMVEIVPMVDTGPWFLRGERAVPTERSQVGAVGPICSILSIGPPGDRRNLHIAKEGIPLRRDCWGRS